jgi:hypothetical protein
MNRQKTILFIVVLALISATAALLAHAKTIQKLGSPGVLTRQVPGSQNLEVVLPDNLPGYTSKWLPQADVVTNTLPPDTSYGQRLYTADDGFQVLANVVLMGTSRASIHKPQICLTAQGWNISEASHEEQIRMDQPVPYDLPVMRLNASRQVEVNGRRFPEQGLYVYWFVDADRITASHVRRFLWMANDVLAKGELDRWAYVAFFSVCAPGQEDAAFERMKKLIIASVPEFQLVPKSAK